jgi:hypothetical protein
MEGVVALFIPMTLFLIIGVCVGLAMYYRFRSRQEMQVTVRSAIDSGQPFSPEVLQELTNALFPPSSDLRKGIVLCAIGIGFVVFALAIGDEEAVGPLLGVSAFPFLVGIAYLILFRMGRNKEARTSGM